jgi:spermidine synthase
MHIYIYELIFFVILISICLLVLRYIGIIRLKKYSSPLLGTIEVWQKFNGEKSLTINRYTHGISTNLKTINKSYWFTIAEEALKHCEKKRNPHVLFLGLGANTASNIIAKNNPLIHQTIIEIDPFIIQACESYFDLKSLPNYTLLQGDAYKLIDTENFKNKFDVIVIDIFTGNPPYVSTRSDKPNFIQKLLKLSNHQGLLVFNRPANTKQAIIDSDALYAYLKTILKEVKVTYIKDPRGFQNNIITGLS